MTAPGVELAEDGRRSLAALINAANLGDERALAQVVHNMNRREAQACALVASTQVWRLVRTIAHDRDESAADHIRAFVEALTE